MGCRPRFQGQMRYKSYKFAIFTNISNFIGTRGTVSSLSSLSGLPRIQPPLSRREVAYQCSSETPPCNLKWQPGVCCLWVCGCVPPSVRPSFCISVCLYICVCLCAFIFVCFCVCHLCVCVLIFVSTLFPLFRRLSSLVVQANSVLLFPMFLGLDQAENLLSRLLAMLLAPRLSDTVPHPSIHPFPA